MKIILFILLLFCSTVIFSSCTKQERAKEFGGTVDINLPKGRKLVNVTWKETNVWF